MYLTVYRAVEPCHLWPLSKSLCPARFVPFQTTLFFFFMGGGLTYKLQLPLFEGQESSNFSVWVYIKPWAPSGSRVAEAPIFLLPRTLRESGWTDGISMGKKLLSFDFCVYYLIRVLKDQRSLVHSEYYGSLDFVWSLVSSGYRGLLEFSWAYCILDTVGP